VIIYGRAEAVAAPVEVLLEQWDTDDLVHWAPGLRDLFFQTLRAGSPAACLRAQQEA
jgi:hypothetical protein